MSLFFKHPTRTHTSDALNTEKPRCMTGTGGCKPAGFGRGVKLFHACGTWMTTTFLPDITVAKQQQLLLNKREAKIGNFQIYGN